MFGLGGLEIVVIFVVALIVLGPEKLPQVASKMARMLGQLRRLVDQVREEVEDAGSAVRRSSQSAEDSLKKQEGTEEAQVQKSLNEVSRKQS